MQKLMPKSFFFGILILSLLIVFVTNWSYFQEKYSPISDTAVNSIRIHKAMEFKELLGPYSRFNYNNLGPTSFYYYALMNKILFFVQDESGRFAMAQLFLNFCFLFWATYIIFIHTKSVNKTLLFFILFTLSIIHLSNDVLSSIWGPHTIIIPFLLLIVSFVSVIENNFYSLIPFTISSTFMAHQHLSVMVIIVPFYIFIFFMIFKKRNKIPIKPVVVSITIFVLLNTLPVIEQLTSNEGNLSKIFKFIFQPKNKTQTFGRAIEYVFSYFGDPLNFLKIDPYVIVFLLIISSAIVYHRSSRFVKCLLIVSNVLLSLAILGAKEIQKTPHKYLMLFLTVLPFIYIFSILLGISEKTLFSKAPKPLKNTLFIVLLLLCLLLPTSAFKMGKHPRNIVDRLVERIKPAKNVSYCIFLKRGSQNHYQWGFALGLSLNMLRSKIDVSMPKEWELICSNLIAKPETKNMQKISFRVRSVPIYKKIFIYKKRQVEWGGLRAKDFPVEINANSEDDFFDNFTTLIRDSRISIFHSSGIRIPLGILDRSIEKYILKIEIENIDQKMLNLNILFNDTIIKQCLINSLEKKVIEVVIHQKLLIEQSENYLQFINPLLREKCIGDEIKENGLNFYSLRFSPIIGFRSQDWRYVSTN